MNNNNLQRKNNNKKKTNNTIKADNVSASKDTDSIVYNVTKTNDETLDTVSKEIAKNADSNSQFTTSASIYEPSFKLYNTFIKKQFDRSSCFKYYTNSAGEKEWRATESPITKYDIIDHMAEDVDIIYGARPLTYENGGNAAQNIVIDIDINDFSNNSSHQSKYSYSKLYDICIDFFGHEGFPVRSSSSENLHIYYPTSEPAPFKFIRDIEKSLNLYLGENRFEVYPKRGALRIPLGHDSAPVDTLCFEPQTEDPDEKVEFFLSGIKETVPITTLYDIQNKINPIFRKHSVNSSGITSSNEWIKKGKELFENGLQPGGLSRHHAQMRVNTYLKYEIGMEDKDEIVDTIFDWIKEKHNDCSQEINAGNYSKVRKDIERIVNSDSNDNGSKRCVSEELKKIDSNSSEYHSVEKYFKNNSVSKRLLNKYKIELHDLIKFLACILRLTKINNSDTIPIASSLIRELGARYERSFNLSTQAKYIKLIKEHEIFKNLAAEYKLMDALLDN